ncbi:MAG: GxxExxY protein [Candidatus Magasanikbacteria bacterium]
MNPGGENILRRNDLLYPELSYKINGILFDVHNAIGGAVPEKYIQKAVATGLEKNGISFQEQYYVPITFEGKHIGKYYLDFLIENCIILELKRGRYVPKSVFSQTLGYIDKLNMKLAIVASFAYDAVIIKRIINHKLL